MPQNSSIKASEESEDSKSSNGPGEPLGISAADTPATRLEKMTFDFASARVQMILGLTLVFFVCLFAYQPTLKVGFLLDDFLHVDYVARAFAGDVHDFLANFTSNWAGSDLMKSYRPLVSVSFALDYLLWHVNAAGYHLTNILLLAACCLLVSLITLELTGRSGNRMLGTPPIWAALLFAVYPLHPEATAWIVGRVDLLCTLFYLASLFFYLRYQQIRESQYLLFSLLACTMSLLSKEMAVTLPAVLTVAAVLLPPSDPPGSSPKEGVNQLASLTKQVFPFWAVLALVALLRTSLLGTLVGGYGESDLHSVAVSFLSFMDRATLWKLVAPVSEELHAGRWLGDLCASLVFAAAIAGLIKNILCHSAWKPILFLCFWCAVAVIPTFQIWHIYPNLVGSRLFFLSSVPFCILLALLAQPATEVVTKRTATVFAIIGSLILSATFVIWSYCLARNLEPWVEAGKRMVAIQTQLEDIKQSAHGHTVSLISLPTDYKGAGMITRPSYLTIMCKPPFHQTDIAKSFATTEPASSDHELSERLRTLITNPICYVYNEQNGVFTPWHRSKGLSHYRQLFGTGDSAVNSTANKTANKTGLGASTTFEILPPETIRKAADGWQVRGASDSYIEQHSDFIRVHPGLQTAGKDNSIWIMAHRMNSLDPLEVQQIVVRCRLHEKDYQPLTDGPNRPTRVSVCWSSKCSEKQTPEFERPLFERSLKYLTSDLLIADVGESADWCLGGNIDRVGIKCPPGNYVIDIYSIKIGNYPSATSSSKTIE